ncbi:MAG: pilus assembly protein PilM, partial [bacterium]
MAVRARVAAIEFAGDEVRLAVVKTGARAPKVLELHSRRAAYEAPEQRLDSLVAAVKSLLKDLKHRPAAIVLCLSSSHSMVRTLTIPFRGARKVASAVRFELEPYLAFPIEELAVDFSPVLEADGQTDVLAVGIRRAVIEEQLNILNAAGIDPEGVDVDALGLTGLWRASRPNMKGLHAVLHVRDEGSVVAVVCNKTLAYFRYLAFGVEGMRSNPAAAAREVLNSMRAFHAGWRGEGEIATLTVTGDAADSESPESDGAWEAFGQYFDIPATRLNLLEVLKAVELAQAAKPAAVSASAEETASGTDEIMYAASGPDEMSAHAVVESVSLPNAEQGPCGSNAWEALIGVALGAAGGGFSMNFRGGDLGPKTALRGVAPNVMVSSCLALLLLAGVAWYYHYGRVRNLAEAEELRVRIGELETEVTALKDKGINLPEETFNDPSLLDILGEIAAKMPDQKVALTEVKIDKSTSSDGGAREAGGPSPPWITIRGEVKDD